MKGSLRHRESDRGVFVLCCETAGVREAHTSIPAVNCTVGRKVMRLSARQDQAGALPARCSNFKVKPAFTYSHAG